MKLSMIAAIAALFMAFTFITVSANAAALPCDCSQDDQGYLQCICAPKKENLPSCQNESNVTAGQPGFDFQLIVKPQGALCPPDSCNYINGCIQGCPRL